MNNNMNSESSKPVVKKRSKWWLKVLIIVGIVLIIGVILGLFNSNSSPVDLVKNGTFNDYPKITVGKAFDKFFANPKWSSFKEDNSQIVEFKGNASLDEKPVTLEMQFEVKNNGFNVIWFAIDGEDQTADELNEWLEVIFKK